MTNKYLEKIASTLQVNAGDTSANLSPAEYKQFRAKSHKGILKSIVPTVVGGVLGHVGGNVVSKALKMGGPAKAAWKLGGAAAGAYALNKRKSTKLKENALASIKADAK